jgi:YVTN family beta-propeller protein
MAIALRYRMGRPPWLALALVCMAATLPTWSEAAPYAYVSNLGAGSVSVIDTATDTVLTTITVGAGPAGVAVRPDGARAYVVNSSAGSVSVIDTATSMVLTTVASSLGAFGVAASPDGERFYVTNRGADSVFAFSTATNGFVGAASYFLDQPLGIAVSRFEPEAYVSVHGGPGGLGANGPGLAEIDTGELSYNYLLRLVSPNGVAVTTQEPNQFYVADGGANAVVSWSATRYPYPFSRTIAVGTDPYGIAVSSDSARLYVANRGSDTVSVIDIATDTVVATIPVGAAPAGISAHPDGRRVYVANSGGDTVSVVDVLSGAVVRTIPVGAQPWAFGQFIKPLCTADADCDDADVCTVDQCSLSAQVCTHVPTDACPTPTPGPTLHSEPNPDAFADTLDVTVAGPERHRRRRRRRCRRQLPERRQFGTGRPGR